MEEIRIITYNVLAQDYITKYPRSYSHVADSSILTRAYRRPNLVKAVTSHGKVDFICLQEFDDIDHWHAEISRRGYGGQYVIRPGKTDGCAIFWDAAKYHMLSHRIVNFNDLVNDPSPVIQANPGKFKRDNVGLIIVLESIVSKQVICVGTCHLFWDPRMEDVKIHQARWMSLQMQAEAAGRRRWILAGDFNSTPSSTVYKYMTGADMEDDDDYGAGKNPLIDSKSVHGNCIWGEPPFTNYTAGFKACIDYIFFGSFGLSVLNLSRIYKKDFDGVIAIPSDVHPSDHLPVYAGFFCNTK